MARPRYKVRGTFFDNMQMHEEGAEVDYDHDPGENLEPLNAEAKARKKSMDGRKPPALPSPPEEE